MKKIAFSPHFCGTDYSFPSYNNAFSAHSCRVAFVLPLVLVLLAALSLIAMGIHFLSVSGYKIGNRSTDSLKAMLLCESLIAEAEAEIRHKLNNEFFTQFQGSSEANLTLECAGGPLTKKLLDDILQEDPTSTPGSVLASNFSIDKLEVKARVWGSFGLSGDDKLRMLTITANARVNGFEKELHASFDIKVVDIRPVANKFALHVEESGADDFNKIGPRSPGDGHLWVIADSSGCDGISIGGNPIINLHSRYNHHKDWKKDNKTRDLKKGSGKNSNKSLVLHDNEPWADKENGKLVQLMGHANGRGMRMLNDGQGTDWEDIKTCPDHTTWKDPGSHPFNSGVNPSTTHLFGKHVENPCTIHGSVQKRWNKWDYEFKDSSHMPDLTCIPGCEAGVSSGCCIAVPTPYGTIYICTHTGERCNNSNDWNMGDTWKVVDKGQATGPYKCDGSDISSFIPLSVDLNAKGSTVSMDQFKKAATRVKAKLTDNDNTLSSSERYYPEGIFFAENGATLKSNAKIRTPGMIVVKNGIVKISGSVAPTGALNRPGGGTYFKKAPTLALVGKTADLPSNQKVQAGIRMEESITGSAVKIFGNLSVRRINKDKFDGDLEYDPKLSSECVNSQRNSVITMTPIVCSWVDTTNMK